MAPAKKGRSSAARKYSSGASKKVEKAMHERKKGTLKSGRSGKTVKSKEQAIAIGLSEARKEGKKVPAPKKSAGRPTAAKRKKSTTRKTAAKRAGARKSSAKRSATGKHTGSTALKGGRKRAASRK